MKTVTLVKLGGGVIAPKNLPANTPDLLAIKNTSRQIAKFLKIKPRSKLIIATGGGNFAHSSAITHKTVDGFSPTNKRARLGACITQQSASEINSLVLKSLLAQGVPATLFPPHAIFTNSSKLNLDPLLLSLKLGLVPIVHGDVIWNKLRGCLIYSGEDLFSLLVANLPPYYRVSKVIMVSAEDGVLDNSGKVIPSISLLNRPSIRKVVTNSPKVDVTGGMLHKLRVAFELAKTHRISTHIISGRRSNRLLSALLDNHTPGTTVS